MWLGLGGFRLGLLGLGRRLDLGFSKLGRVLGLGLGRLGIFGLGLDRLVRLAVGDLLELFGQAGQGLLDLGQKLGVSVAQMREALAEGLRELRLDGGRLLPILQHLRLGHSFLLFIYGWLLSGGHGHYNKMSGSC